MATLLEYNATRERLSGPNGRRRCGEFVEDRRKQILTTAICGSTESFRDLHKSQSSIRTKPRQPLFPPLPKSLVIATQSAPRVAGSRVRAALGAS